MNPSSGTTGGLDGTRRVRTTYSRVLAHPSAYRRRPAGRTARWPSPRSSCSPPRGSPRSRSPTAATRSRRRRRGPGRPRIGPAPCPNRRSRAAGEPRPRSRTPAGAVRVTPHRATGDHPTPDHAAAHRDADHRADDGRTDAQRHPAGRAAADPPRRPSHPVHPAAAQHHPGRRRAGATPAGRSGQHRRHRPRQRPTGRARSTATELRVTVTNTGEVPQLVRLRYTLPAGRDRRRHPRLLGGRRAERTGAAPGSPAGRRSSAPGSGSRSTPTPGSGCHWPVPYRSAPPTRPDPGSAAVTDDEGFAVLFPPGPTSRRIDARRRSRSAST